MIQWKERQVSMQGERRHTEPGKEARWRIGGGSI